MSSPDLRGGTAGNGGATPALDVRSASKTFGSIRVLHDVDLTLAAGELRALVGENGSGKSTLVKILAGYHMPDEGTRIAVGGREVAPHHAGVSETAGLRFVHQDLALVGALSSVENLGLGRGYGNGRMRPLAWSRLRREAREAIGELGYHFDVDRPVATLGASERTALAVARAVSPHTSTARVLVLDEPTANLPGPEVEQLFGLVRRVRDAGIAVLFISHHLNEVFDLAESVSVLRGGEHVATRPVAELDETSLIELMVGHSVERHAGRRPSAAAATVLSAQRLSGGSVQRLDLDVAAGEIVGIAGITGSGREAVASLMFGAEPAAGTVTVNGSPIPPGRPDASIAAGMGLVPAERATKAVMLGHDVAENLSISRPKDFVRRGSMRRRLEYQAAAGWLEKLDVRPREPRMPLAALSGGNAQKVILARWLRLQPKVLVLDEPTQGVDVGAKEDIHQRIEEAAGQGCAVVVCSTDNEELARLCGRVIVLGRGLETAQLAAPISADDITAACLADTRERSPREHHH
ncbi:MAG: Ribose ABC transport system, ATP-binding protein RbsA [uncultured Thermomicrobiales bacterium]|uniref:Ribose ABC transport system, ATP-binding protein RbsA n=1 Tax=uncultured Thermomicrobiales bacterium TaxID=1645740 RepID=A0A6J4VHA3_9BACT|nr:MAG: Ribose ABC transport system, ATP-binding protein RbsA [uncultured Thermomicrobiales bacterium]